MHEFCPLCQISFSSIKYVFKSPELTLIDLGSIIISFLPAFIGIFIKVRPADKNYRQCGFRFSNAFEERFMVIAKMIYSGCVMIIINNQST